MSLESPVRLSAVLKTLLLCSEKAATVARQVKMGGAYFQSLIQTKEASEANSRFVVDVKTLADVLIQEVVRFDLENAFPGFGRSVFGEESNTFRCANSGKSVVVSIPDSAVKLSSLLTPLLSNSVVAHALSETVFRSLDSFLTCQALKQQFGGPEFASHCSLDRCFVSLSHCGVWIDPIDATACYVENHLVMNALGTNETINRQKSHLISETSTSIQVPDSLANVTVLIGLFDRLTGLPILGVLNQPFWLRSEAMSVDSNILIEHLGRVFWGCSLDNDRTSSIKQLDRVDSPSQMVHLGSFPNTMWLYVSSAMRHSATSKFEDCLRIACSSVELVLLSSVFQDWKHSSHVVFVSPLGAGFKFLSLCLDEVDAYLLFKACTYFWDVCGPHAILLSLGGGIIRLMHSIQRCRLLIREHSRSNDDDLEDIIMSILPELQLSYCDKEDSSNLSAYCNADGFLAYRDPKVASRLLVHLARVTFQ